MVRGVVSKHWRSTLLGTALAVASLPAIAQTNGAAIPPEPAADEPAPPSPGRLVAFTPRFQIRELFTDNALLTSTGRKADFLTTVSPGFNIRVQGARTRLDFDYSLDYDYYARSTSLNGFRHNLAGTGNVELLQRSIFVDVSAFAGQDRISANSGTSAVDRRLANNSSQAYSYSISPYWIARYGPYATSNLRYRFAQYFSESNTPTTVTATNTLAPVSNTTLNDVSGSVNSGEYFGQLGWGVSGGYRSSRTGSGSRFSSWNGAVNGTYHINRTYAALASIGYQNIDSGSGSQSTNGITWNVGLTYTPHERLSATIRYGRQYEQQSFSGDLSYQITPQTSLTASYSESVTTQQQLALEGLGFITTDPNTGQLIDSRTGLPFIGRDPRFDQNNQVFIQRQYQASFRALRGRNTYIINFFYTTRDTDITQDTASNQSQRSYSGSVVYSRQISRATDANASAAYTRSTTNGGGNNRTLRFDINVRYQMSRTLTATAGYAFLDRDAQGQQLFANQSTGSFRENVLFVTLRKSF
ncbi:MAG: TIGR03016 family PEP-CTERM system-associated outer membrane protein [Alphaproteobacteria bacterium]|nr:TIGR03016 family PEP-CTERM system-associated outer membrane protein [Alphaproteobacteria bacterium]